MPEIRLGGITVSSGGGRLIFQKADHPNREVAVGADALGELVTYLESLNPDESDLRAGFRVPIPRDAGLKACVSEGKVIWLVRTLDISLSGIFVELQRHAHQLPLNSGLEVELEYDTKCVILHGVARRRNGSRYGISFTDTFRWGKLEPPDSLMVIVKQLETDWLSKQAEAGMPVF